MATLNLGRIKPVFRGAYAGGTAYVVDDIVTSGNETFICILASTGNATSNATYWTKLAAKGTDGTDVGTTITTQGDILFRDGSGLQRLAKGTAAQVLSMNSGATAPEWAAASGGGFTLIENINVTSAASTIDFDNCFSATYDNYVMIGFVRPSTSGHIYGRQGHGATPTYITGSVYQSYGAYWHSTDSESRQNDANQVYHKISGLDSGTITKGFQLNFYNFGTHSSGTAYNNYIFSHTGHSSHVGGDSRMELTIKSHATNDANLPTSYRLYPSSGNFDEANVSMFGVNKS